MTHFVGNNGYFKSMKDRYTYALNKLVRLPVKPYACTIEYVYDEVQDRTKGHDALFTGLIIAGLTIIPVLPAATALAITVALTAALLLSIVALFVLPVTKLIDFLKPFILSEPNNPRITHKLINDYYNDSDNSIPLNNF